MNSPPAKTRVGARGSAGIDSVSRNRLLVQLPETPAPAMEIRGVSSGTSTNEITPSSFVHAYRASKSAFVEGALIPRKTSTPTSGRPSNCSVADNSPVVAGAAVVVEVVAAVVGGGGASDSVVATGAGVLGGKVDSTVLSPVHAPAARTTTASGIHR